jgi:hypothetical protein
MQPQSPQTGTPQNWYVFSAGRTLPVSTDDLVAGLMARDLAPDVLVARPGESSWSKASEVPSLLEEARRRSSRPAAAIPIVDANANDTAVMSSDPLVAKPAIQPIPGPSEPAVVSLDANAVARSTPEAGPKEPTDKEAPLPRYFAWIPAGIFGLAIVICVVIAVIGHRKERAALEEEAALAKQLGVEYLELKSEPQKN